MWRHRKTRHGLLKIILEQEIKYISLESVLAKKNDKFLEYDETTVLYERVYNSRVTDTHINSTVISSYSENSSFLLTRTDSSKYPLRGYILN